MEPFDGLIKEHETLRRLMQEMLRIVPKTDAGSDERLGKDSVERLRKAEEEFRSILEKHERIEDSVLDQAIRAVGDEGQLVARTVRAEHSGILETVRILTALEATAGDHTIYSLRFVLTSLEYQLQRHLEYEERVAFPFLTRVRVKA